MKHLIALAFILSNPVHASELNRVSYFKDANRNRVMVYQSAPDSTASDIEAAMASVAHTPGRFTLVYVYPHDATNALDWVTLLPDYLSAVEVMYSPPAKGWGYNFQINPLNKQIFTDCIADPERAVCGTEND